MINAGLDTKKYLVKKEERKALVSKNKEKI